MANKKRNMIQISITLSPDVFEMVENESSNLGVNRSAFISMCVTNYFNINEARKTANELKDLINISKYHLENHLLPRL